MDQKNLLNRLQIGSEEDTGECISLPFLVSVNITLSTPNPLQSNHLTFFQTIPMKKSSKTVP